MLSATRGTPNLNQSKQHQSYGKEVLDASRSPSKQASKRAHKQTFRQTDKQAFLCRDLQVRFKMTPTLHGPWRIHHIGATSWWF
mmetsp:Transcript_3330/g.4559  ORF Transcript_3330/g.4559 Transcript_3330/m.4559 type:complete len:84 (+) Transcript_3330:142-393(+)